MLNSIKSSQYVNEKSFLPSGTETCRHEVNAFLFHKLGLKSSSSLQLLKKVIKKDLKQRSQLIKNWETL